MCTIATEGQDGFLSVQKFLIFITDNQCCTTHEEAPYQTLVFLFFTFLGVPHNRRQVQVQIWYGQAGSQSPETLLPINVIMKHTHMEADLHSAAACAWRSSEMICSALGFAAPGLSELSGGEICSTGERGLDKKQTRCQSECVPMCVFVRCCTLKIQIIKKKKTGVWRERKLKARPVKMQKDINSHSAWSDMLFNITV